MSDPRRISEATRTVSRVISAWTFRSLRAPALSWLVGRSFYWKTLLGERGREFVLIERRYQSVPQDTLVLVIDVGTP